MPIDPHLARICEADFGLIRLGRALQPYDRLVGLALEHGARRSIRRRQRERLRLERQLVAELGYLDLGGEG